MSDQPVGEKDQFTNKPGICHVSVTKEGFLRVEIDLNAPVNEQGVPFFAETIIGALGGLEYAKNQVNMVVRKQELIYAQKQQLKEKGQLGVFQDVPGVIPLPGMKRIKLDS